MTSKPTILNLTINNLPAFGEVLHTELLKSNRNLYHIPENYPQGWIDVRKAMNEILTRLGLDTYADTPITNATRLRIGDIVEVGSGRSYMVTGISGELLRTFPAYLAKDKAGLDPNSFNFKGIIKRPKLSEINSENYEALVRTALPEEILEDRTLHEGKFKAIPLTEDSTHLQIGDLIFGVDPIQLSFTTQNGYQYFPTLRTQGNPKLPTMQQIKNINITLIFPNADSINYQLIPLFAMFKRTPFVNIKNRDLVRFYQDIATIDGYIPVALETIHIQSVEGFPNSAQANITLLPFDPGHVGKGTLSALKTFDDVFIQQENMDKDLLFNHMMELADFKMQEKDPTISRFKELTQVVSESTENFRESVPFRAFYQALIQEHKFVRDEYGNPVKLYSTDDLTRSAGEDLSFLSPKNLDHYLHHYIPEANQNPIRIAYNYPSILDADDEELTELRDVTRYISDERIDNRSERLNTLRQTFTNLSGYAGLANAMFSAFHNMEDALRPAEYQFSRLENSINTILAMHGLDPIMTRYADGQKVGISKLLEFMYRSIMHNIGVAEISSAFRQLSNAGEATYDAGASDMWALLGKKGLLYTEVNGGELSQYGVHTLEGAFKNLWAWVQEDPKTRKQQLLNVMESISQYILGNWNGTTLLVVSAGESVDQSEYAVRRIPIQRREFEIDNRKDVITSWSLAFSNKFVPIYLLAYKYPFYQHIGSEDAMLSLSITSVPSDNKFDLKSELALMSDKMYDSVKLVMHTAPDLYTWLDPRATITASAGSIFHAFGIKKIVINSSNSTNVQGQPDVWNTVINLTQANFSLEQYHTLSSVPSLAEFESVIAHLIPRLRINANGQFEVLNLRHPDKKLTLDDVLYLSFLLSPHGVKFIEHVKGLFKGTGIDPTQGGVSTEDTNITGDDLLNQVAKHMRDLTEIDTQTINKEATERIRQITAENRKFSELLEAIIYEYDHLLETQASAFISLVTRLRSRLEKDWAAIKNSWKLLTLDFAILAVLSFVPIVNFVVIPVGAIGGGFFLASNIAAEWATDAAKGQFSGLISRLIDTYKKEMLAQLSHAVMKDPPIRKRLFDPIFISFLFPSRTNGEDQTQVDLEKAIEDAKNFKKVNCYQDFDIPLTWERDGRIYRASPDFYLHNVYDPLYYTKTYVKESTERLMKIGKMGVQLALVEHKNLFEKFDQLQKQIKEAGDQQLGTIMDDIGNELGFTNLPDSLNKLGQIYRVSTFSDRDISVPDTEITAEIKGITINDERKEALIGEFEKINSNLKERDPKLYEYELDILKYSLKMNIAPKIQNTDVIKFNIIWTARMRTLLEILATGHQIQSYFAEKTAIYGSKREKDAAGKVKDIFWSNLKSTDGSKQILVHLEEKTEELRDSIFTILDNWRVATTTMMNYKPGADLPAKSKLTTEQAKSLSQKLEVLKNKYNKGLYAQAIDEGSTKKRDVLEIPMIRQLEADLYNKIGYYIRLNTVIEQANAGILKPYTGNVPKISFDTLPELQFIDAFNVRNTEAVFRQLEIERQLLDSAQRTKSATAAFFPAFKIYFIEEDATRQVQLDDYYAYNAVQSIEIAKSKDSASTTAVLRLSNLTGNITDRLSFHRERSDFMQANDPYTEDDVFFGTLDVKPGTKIQIKLGYAADERYLPTVFTGRILEMSVGPTTEIICQSFGAQLNHVIFQKKFGFFASEKEYGDIASALLDVIPGLENLGKKEVINFAILGGFRGTDLKKIRGNLFDNFALSTVLGKLSADLVGTDNPRDENIYLSFNLSTIPKWKPRFDWVVYNQSVWDAIREISLYVNNCNVVIKQYNNDPISERSDQRETLVVGNKSGYYKFTDSLSFSSIDTDDIIIRIDEFKEIWNASPGPKLARDVITAPFFDRPKEKVPLYFLGEYGGTGNNIENAFYNNMTVETIPLGGEAGVAELITYANLKPQHLRIWQWMSDPTNATVLKKALVSQIDLTIKNASDFAAQAFKKLTKSVTDPMALAVEAIDSFFNSDSVTDPLSQNIIGTEKGKVFPKILYYMNRAALIRGFEDIWDMQPEEFFSVRSPIFNNMNPRLASDPRYKKIQQHHFISDSLNLISNDIALNSNFPNKINLYYLDEPQFIDSINSVSPEKWDQLNIWPIQAFGDIRDEHIRQMDVFQKNIDPWWMDIREKQEQFFKGYKRLLFTRMSDKEPSAGDSKEDAANSQFSSYVENLNSNLGTFNIHTPDWRAFPAFQIVGVNLLKKEVAKMYRGTIQIIGDPYIEPLDIVHLEDYINDMHGVVEVDEVVHTFTPDRGLITTITPSLVTYDRDPIQMEDVAVINRIYDVAQEHRRITTSKLTWGTIAAAGGATLVAGTGGKGTIVGGAVAGIGVAAAWSGLIGLLGNRYHKFLYDNMGNILGRDVINFTTLLYHGLPYMCGFDGVDYTNLKTLMLHRAENVDSLVTRLSVFSDEFAASIYTNFNPEEWTPWKAIANKLGIYKMLFNMPTHGQLNDAFQLRDVLNPFGGG